MTLAIAGNGTVTFDVPPMTKLDEVEEAGRYRYVASSIGHNDQSFGVLRAHDRRRKQRARRAAATPVTRVR